MNNIFITHTPLLLEEFPVNGTMLIKHEARTPKRTAIFTEALQSLGHVTRINLTLWFLATEHSAGEVHNAILDRLKSESRTDCGGDIFVIETSKISCSTSQEIATELTTLFDGKPVVRPISNMLETKKSPALFVNPSTAPLTQTECPICNLKLINLQKHLRRVHSGLPRRGSGKRGGSEPMPVLKGNKAIFCSDGIVRSRCRDCGRIAVQGSDRCYNCGG